MDWNPLDASHGRGLPISWQCEAKRGLQMALCCCSVGSSSQTAHRVRRPYGRSGCPSHRSQVGSSLLRRPGDQNDDLLDGRAQSVHTGPYFSCVLSVAVRVWYECITATGWIRCVRTPRRLRQYVQEPLEQEKTGVAPVILLSNYHLNIPGLPLVGKTPYISLGRAAGKFVGRHPGSGEQSPSRPLTLRPGFRKPGRWLKGKSS